MGREAHNLSLRSFVPQVERPVAARHGLFASDYRQANLKAPPSDVHEPVPGFIFGNLINEYRQLAYHCPLPTTLPERFGSERQLKLSVHSGSGLNSCAISGRSARPSLAVQLAGDAIAPDTRVTGISPRANE